MLSGSSIVELQLVSGVLEVAGELLDAVQPHTFHLRAGEGPLASMIIYTLEGGVVSVRSKVPVTISRNASGSVAQLCGFCSPLLNQHFSSSLRFLVIGRKGSGKTHTAHTLCNLIHRSSLERGAHMRTFLVDLNPSNALFAPGAVSSRDVTGSALTLGQTAHPLRSSLTLNFFHGSTQCPSTPQEEQTFMHFAEQCVETTSLWADETVGDENHRGACHLVVDAPAPCGEVRELLFFKNLIKVVQPTHVIVLTDSNSSTEKQEASHENPEDSEASQWGRFLQEDTERMMPDCEFLFLAPLPTKTVTDHRDSDEKKRIAALLVEYFIGSPSTCSLGCSKVVLPVSALQFVSLDYSAESLSVKAVKCDASRITENTAKHGPLVCSLSHAEIMDEVPLAPSAGLFVLVHLDEEADEVVLLIPANGAAPLVRRFAVLPVSRAENPVTTLTEEEEAAMTTRWDEGLSLSHAHLALVEASSV